MILLNKTMIQKRLETVPKGCLNKNGVCMARFPRDLYPETVVNKDDGHIFMKKTRIYDEYFYTSTYIFVTM